MNVARVMSHAELMASMNAPLPESDVDGTRRTAYRGLATNAFKTNLVVMPEGQRSTTRASDVEHIIYVLEGCFEFDIDGARYQLGVMDQIFVPTDVSWSYRNTFRGPSRFLSVTDP